MKRDREEPENPRSNRPFKISDEAVAVFALRHIYGTAVRETPNAWRQPVNLAVVAVNVRVLLAFHLALIGENDNELPAFYSESKQQLEKLGDMIEKAAHRLRRKLGDE